ncbi:hypothetical protein TWF694_003690 [Orbilia ellipsospora]|uniref:Geranylgeranyl pyrophosphate synthase n=1 Tax=Orbilia ellipsospora TaxID=2528407 RepID=A0AAV9WYZ4_9PEZI
MDEFFSTPNSEEKVFIPCFAQYKNSRPIPARFLEGYYGILEPRVNIAADEEAEIIRSVEEEWKTRGGCLARPGLLADPGGALSLLFAEADPARLVNATPLTAFTPLADDWWDGEAKLLVGDDEAAQKLQETVISQMRAKIFLEMLKNDKNSVHWVEGFSGWGFDVVESEHRVGVKFDSLQDYLDKRAVTFGINSGMAILRYLCDIKLTDQQFDDLEPIMRAASEPMILANEIASLEKDWITHAGLHRPGIPPNAVLIVMETEDVSIAEAKEILKQKHVALEKKLIELCRDCLERCLGPRKELERHLSGLKLAVSGNLMWHIHHPRYRADSTDPLYLRPEYKLRDFPRPPEGQLRTRTSKSISSQANGRPKFVGLIKETKNSPVASQVLKATSLIEEDLANEGKSRKRKREMYETYHEPTPHPWVRSHSDLTDEVLSICFIPISFAYLKPQVVLEPFDYVKSLPCKKIRKVAIEALDIWYNVPQRSIDVINSVIDMLHSSSLIIDDIEDNTELRRGQPSAHMVFGTPQAINSANYLFVKCLQEVQKLSPAAVAIFAKELGNLHIGQGLDLNWTFHNDCPSEEDYIKMIDGKTGGLFRMASLLMRAEATQNRNLVVEDLLTMMGRFFQIRDDYQNLCSKDCASAKGSFSDLDEGKFSFMMIHALKSVGAETSKLKSLFQLRSRQMSLSTEQKALIIGILEKTKAMEYTLSVLNDLEMEIEKKIENIEGRLEAPQEKN